jgi:flagellar basal-body rod modification protein FlgD
MIGHNVLVSGNEVNSTGEGGYFGVDLPSGADKLSVVIKNSAGATVRTIDMGKQDFGTIPLQWNGLTDNGSVAPAGDYKFEIAATVAGKGVVADSLNYAKVMSISNHANGLKLNLSNSTAVNTSDVREIY